MKTNMWANYMSMFHSLKAAREATPKAEWDDLRCYHEVDADLYDYNQTVINSLNHEIKMTEAREEKLRTALIECCNEIQRETSNLALQSDVSTRVLKIALKAIMETARISK